MTGKFKLMCLLSVSVWLAAISGQSAGRPLQSPRLLIIGSYFSGDLGGNIEHRYEVLRAFIVNYSDDTLKFWGTDCHPTDLFSITKNDYMNLSDEECNNGEFEQLAIPPHRSLLIPLKMLIEKQPHEIVRLKVEMKFYKWFKSNDFKADSKFHDPEILSDTASLKYDKDGNSYASTADWDEQQQKEKLNLPTTSLHLLTNEEKKNYTITIDQNKIFKRMNQEYPYEEKKFFILPVTVHNDSNDTLRYCSMTCSWQEFYRIDNEEFEILSTSCTENIPAMITVLPHSVNTTNIAFVRKKDNQANPVFRVGLNINTSGYSIFYHEELFRYNIVWSNEIQFAPK
jgi:hypothetical protein